MATTTTAASQEAAAAIEAMEAENAEAIEGLPMQVIAKSSITALQENVKGGNRYTLWVLINTFCII